ncbi:MAG: hypothetical protein V3S93_02505 [Methyloceanibacter sp.]|nr:hypothetical protein [Hyphomicrobiaceae bacterium]
MIRPVIGIDPGADGGAVILQADGQTALDAFRWRKGVGGYNVRSIYGPSTKVPTLAHVGDRIARAFGHKVWLGVEGLFVPRPNPGHLHVHPGQIRHVLTLAENAALVYGPMLGKAERVERPTAAVWRPAILGIARNASSKSSEAAAIAACTKMRPPIVTGLRDLGEDPHVAEAACIARYTWLAQVGESKLNGGRAVRNG